MLKFLLVTGGVLAALALTACGGPGADTSGREIPPDAEVRVYEVFGMDCPGCHGGLNKLVERLPGVLNSEASYVTQKLTVAVSPKADLDDETVFDAIKRANFTPGKRLE